MQNNLFAGTLPIQGSDIAAQWDLLYWFLVALSAFFFVLVVGGMIVFAIKYRHKTGTKTKYITGSHALEGIFVVVPTILLMVIFFWGYKVYRNMVTAPADAYEIRVIGKQWLWQFLYENGKVTIGDVYVPLNKPVKFIMTSEDVIHSFFVPSFRVKQDVVPGMYTSVWFEAKVPGKHHIFCAEYCGASHSGMVGSVKVLTDNQWKDWLKGKEIADSGQVVSDAGKRKSAKGAGGGLVDKGKGYFMTKGCVACHSVDGAKSIGPTLKGVFGSQVELADGKSVTADENFLKESIEAPNAKVVKGFAPTMPAFKGILTEQEIMALIAYIKSVK